MSGGRVRALLRAAKASCAGRRATAHRKRDPRPLPVEVATIWRRDPAALDHFMTGRRVKTRPAVESFPWLCLVEQVQS